MASEGGKEIRTVRFSNNRNLSTSRQDVENNEENKRGFKKRRKEYLQSENEDDEVVCLSKANTVFESANGTTISAYVNSTPDIFDYEDLYGFPEEVHCAVCLDTVDSSAFTYITCCHSFHVQCIQTWFEIREICPICMVNNSSSASEDDPADQFLENVKCKLCMDIEISFDFQQLSCNHNFHAMCLQSWMQDNETCPTCKNDIPVSNVSNEIPEQGREDMRCAICCDTQESSTLEFLPCCHGFHEGCIQSWLEVEETCPICKTVTSVNHTNSGIFEETNMHSSGSQSNNTFYNPPLSNQQNPYYQYTARSISTTEHGGNIENIVNTNVHSSGSRIAVSSSGNGINFSSSGNEITIFSSGNGINISSSETGIQIYSSGTDLNISSSRNGIVVNGINICSFGSGNRHSNRCLNRR